jgi:arsenate reductase
MAEGWARHLKGKEIEACSAGVAPQGLDPRAVAAMAEAGVDISAQRSKGVDEFLGRDFDFVITLCDNARENCPFFPGEAKLVHRGFEDPPVLASKARSEEEAMVHYRRVRDEIRDFVGGLPGLLDEGG